MRAICKQLGVERATPHDLRRTHGTTITALRLRSRRHEPDPEPQGGRHRQRYDRHEYADENKRVMEAVAAKIMALVEGTPDDKCAMPVKR